MRLQDLRPPFGAKKNVKRVGRGTGSGHGKTAGRGSKGQLSRSGGGKGAGFQQIDRARNKIIVQGQAKRSIGAVRANGSIGVRRIADREIEAGRPGGGARRT